VSATFLPHAGNGYQGGNAGFVFCVGFGGENENCVSDASTPDDPGGGDGGGGERISLSDRDGGGPNTPEGEVEGVATSTLPQNVFDGVQAFVRPFFDQIGGMVLGDTATATTSTSTIPENEEDSSIADEVAE